MTVLRSALDSLARAIGLPVHALGAAPGDVRAVAPTLLSASEGEIVEFSTEEGRYLACRYHEKTTSILVAGPYRRPSDLLSDAPTLNPDQEHSASEMIKAVAVVLGQGESERLQRLELASQVEVTSSLVLAITGELDLTTVLHRIVDLARELAGARYAALGVPNERGEMAAFVTSGMSDEEEGRISHRPRGLGILGMLLREPRIIRLPNLNEHPAAAGFPANHPPMTSFLGVPIISRGVVLGNLYLTEKRFGSEFTDNDARLVDLLARHAAVAIENARLYEAIERQQRRLQVIIDQLPEAVLIVEPNPDRVAIANRHTWELLGWSGALPMPLDEFISHNERHLPDGSPMRPGMAVVESLHDGTVVARREVRVSQPDGSSITILVNSGPMFDDEGRITGAISVFQDITQIKDAEQLKDDFLSLVSHELRTPLTAIQGGALLLQQDWDALELETRQELLTDISSEARRLATLIENMVHIANIRAGRLLMETEPIHVRRVIDRAVEAERNVAPKRPFEVETEPHLFGLADHSRMEQLVRNLLHNAVKYTPANTPIEVRAYRLTENGRAMIAIAVRDHGPGIREEDLPFVFERFHRSRAEIQRGTPGMGLGLYLARHLVEAHGGRIWIEHPDDGGACVVFTIPDADEEE
jgi:K+-sensing histidine kinase KdpD